MKKEFNFFYAVLIFYLLMPKLDSQVSTYKDDENKELQLEKRNTSRENYYDTIIKYLNKEKNDGKIIIYLDLNISVPVFLPHKGFRDSDTILNIYDQNLFDKLNRKYSKNNFKLSKLKKNSNKLDYSILDENFRVYEVSAPFDKWLDYIIYINSNESFNKKIHFYVKYYEIENYEVCLKDEFILTLQNNNGVIQLEETDLPR